MKPTRKQFEALVLEQLDMLYRVARRIAPTSAEAEDLVQETCVRAIQRWEKFDLVEGRGIRPWLIRLMYNLHHDRSQREMRQPRPIDSTEIDLIAGISGEVQFLEKTGMEMMDQRLVRALRRLPLEYQVVVLLWGVEEMSYEEIAEGLEIPIGTVMSRLHRARAKLTEQLRGYAEKEGLIRAAHLADN